MIALIGKKRNLLLEDGFILDDDAKCFPESAKVYDFRDDLILPAFIELHAHGGGGSDFVDNTQESYDRILDTHLSHGVAAICPTLCSCDFESMLKFLEDRRTHRGDGFAGVHLEGPFLSAKMCGAQNLSYITPPTDEIIERLSDYTDIISRITAAPEVDGVMKLANRLSQKGVRFSIGHSDADAKLTRKAVESGFSSVTHIFCATSGRRKQDGYVVGGLLEEALINDGLSVELIGDGHHICRESFYLTLKCKSSGSIAVVSDAMRAAGIYSPDSPDDSAESYLGAKLPENRVIIEDGVAKLPDRSSFAGSIAVGDTMFRTLCKDYRLPVDVVSEMMSLTPAKMLGLCDRGEIKKGLRADIVILDSDYSTKAVLREGKFVYRRKEQKC